MTERFSIILCFFNGKAKAGAELLKIRHRLFYANMKQQLIFGTRTTKIRRLKKSLSNRLIFYFRNFLTDVNILLSCWFSAIIYQLEMTFYSSSIYYRIYCYDYAFFLLQAVSDLLLGVFCMPFTLVGQVLRNFIFGAAMCKLIPYFQGKLILNFI